MTVETENLVLELLRGMRADMADLRRDIAAVNARLDGIDARLDAVDTQLEGLRHVFVASIGSLVADVKDHETRIAALEASKAPEGARA